MICFEWLTGMIRYGSMLCKNWAQLGVSIACVILTAVLRIHSETYSKYVPALIFALFIISFYVFVSQTADIRTYRDLDWLLHISESGAFSHFHIMAHFRWESLVVDPSALLNVLVASVVGPYLNIVVNLTVFASTRDEVPSFQKELLLSGLSSVFTGCFLGFPHNASVSLTSQLLSYTGENSWTNRLSSWLFGLLFLLFLCVSPLQRCISLIPVPLVSAVIIDVGWVGIHSCSSSDL